MPKGFPKNFFFGAATSSHQVEGHNENDWTAWERKNAARLAKNSPSIYNRTPNWLRVEPEAIDPQNYISGRATDHWNLYEKDYELASEMGLNSYRLSIEWSRIEPSPGYFDKEALEHYRKMIKALKMRGLEPFVTVWHFTLPAWLAEIGGVTSEHFVMYFERYAEHLASALGKDVTYWLTMNEPEIYLLNGYLRGTWPPGKQDVPAYFTARRNLLAGHKAAYAAIRRTDMLSTVGAAFNITDFESGGGFINDTFWKLANNKWNFYFLENLKDSLDFIGLNYYFHNRINYGLNKNANQKISDLGWEIYPAGIRVVLERLKIYNLPVYITENGVADRDDNYRGSFIREALEAVKDAVQSGIDVRGYFYWSLLDNFEWDKGFWPRFGLIEVDYKTMARRVRPSAGIYKSIIMDSTGSLQEGG
jgi:beta-glucosidase